MPSRYAAPRQRRPKYDNPKEYRKIGKTELTLTFPAKKILGWFDLPDNEDIFENMLEQDFGSAVDLTNTVCLDVSAADDDELGEVLVDHNDQPIPEEAAEALTYAVRDSEQFGTERAIMDRRDDALKQGLEAFSNYQYEYDYHTWDSMATAKGVAKGITGVELVNDGTVAITMNTDIVYAINDCINGYGEFAVVEDFIGAFSAKETLEDFIRGHFHWLSYYWEIYGAGSKPRLDYDNVDDFDQGYFKDEVLKVEQEYGLKLWSCR
jgi:hypothetical protein